MWVISKEHSFSASHVLAGLPEGHPCGRLHGHNYNLRITVSADELDATGFVVDYHDLAHFTGWVDERLDHRHLNDVEVLHRIHADLTGSVEDWHRMNPTAENLSMVLSRVLRNSLSAEARGLTVAVAVSETPKTWATWQS
jgi:6-pyruvoyltetrahydropterin/6-carboxytetrahydropterin synthase